MIFKFLLIQFFLICSSRESPVEDRPPSSAQLEENSSNFRYKTHFRIESRTQNDIQSAETLSRDKRAVYVNISDEEVTASSPFKVIRRTDADSLASNKSERNSSVTSRPNQSYDKLRSAINEFPPDFMSDKFRDSGGFVVHIFIFIYFCLVLAVVCDEYFIESLEFISEALSLPPDIAGATFMAIGTSAPELFTSVIGVFISDNDIGTGTIVGSAVFNLIVIPGACGFAAYYNLKKMPKISSFPIIRDTIFYIMTIITLILCIKDNKVDWVESVTFLALYVLYIVIMFFNAQFSHLLTALENEQEDEEETPLLKSKKKVTIEEDYDNNHLEDYSKIELAKAQDGKYNEVRRSGSSGSNESNGSEGTTSEVRVYPRLYGADENGSGNDPEAEKNWTEHWFLQIILFPFTILFKITLPRPTRFCFVFTFIMSIVWIALLTYIIVWMTTLVGYSIGIPDTLSGITILAAGTSIPELISSYIVVKKAGLANMALCNSIGSNIFDILFCLGFPWLLKSLVAIITKGAGFTTLANTSISIHSAALPLTSLSLLITCFLMLLTLKLAKWRLGLNVGIICMVIYIVFVVVSSTLELNI